MAGMKQFETRTEPVRFAVDRDVFEATPDIPAATMFRLAGMRSDLQGEDREQQWETMESVFRELLTDESFSLLKERLRSRDRPIGLKTMNEIIEWLMGEAYGVRPTGPSPSSTEQSAATGGPTSTAGAQPEQSTQPPSGGPGS